MEVFRDFHGGKVLEISKKSNIEVGEFLDFSANISPFLMEKEIKEKLYNSIDDIVYYPETDYEDIYIKLASLHNINKAYIRLGNGAIDIIYKLAAFLNLKKGKKRKVLFVEPSFIEYRKAFRIYEDIDLVYYDMDKENLKLDESILDILDNDMLAIFICNPNNPSSCLVEKEILNKILKKCKEKDIYLVLDECFMDFILEEDKYSLVSNIEENKKLIILRSFTKLFAVAGLRLGYTISSDRFFLKSMDLLNPHWNINTLALRVADLAADIYIDLKNKNLDLIEKERKYLIQELEDLKIKVYESKANFILLRLDKNYDDFEQYLLKYKILIRSCSNYRGLDGRYYRIAIRTHKDNVKLINVFKEYFR